MQKQIDSTRADNQTKMDGLNKQIATLKSSTTDSTADWKTYTNATVGFSIKYPPTDTVSTASSYFEDDGVFIDSTSTGGYEQPHLISIEAEHSSLSLDAYIAKATKDASFTGATKNTFVGLSAYEGLDNGMTTLYGILVKNGANIFHISADTGNLDGLAKNKAALTTVQNQILSTFQFAK